MYFYFFKEIKTVRNGPTKMILKNTSRRKIKTQKVKKNSGKESQKKMAVDVSKQVTILM